MCMGVLSVCLYVHHMHAVPRSKIVGSLGAGVIDSCELPREFLEQNPGHLQKQQLLLTTESSLKRTYLSVFVCV